MAGIIESGQLRFSNIFVQNDPSELRHGLTIAIDILKLRATAARLEVATFASMLVMDYQVGTPTRFMTARRFVHPVSMREQLDDRFGQELI